MGHFFDHAVDGFGLVVAGLLVAAVIVIGFGDEGFLIVCNASETLVARPQFRWRGKGIQPEFGFSVFAFGSHLVMAGKAVAVGTEGAGHIKDFGIAQGLLQAMADGVVVFLGLDHRYRHTFFLLEHVVGEFLLFLVARG